MCSGEGEGETRDHGAEIDELVDVSCASAGWKRSDEPLCAGRRDASARRRASRPSILQSLSAGPGGGVWTW